MTKTSTLVDHTGRVLMVWQGEPPMEPESVRRFIDKTLGGGTGKNTDKRKRGKVVRNG